MISPYLVWRLALHTIVGPIVSEANYIGYHPTNEHTIDLIESSPDISYRLYWL